MTTEPAMKKSCLDTSIAQHIWETKYRLEVDGVPQERSIEDSWKRVANTLASVEERDAGFWEERFYSILEDFRFLPLRAPWPNKEVKRPPENPPGPPKKNVRPGWPSP